MGDVTQLDLFSGLHAAQSSEDSQTEYLDDSLAENWPDPDPWRDMLSCLYVLPGVDELFGFIVENGRLPFVSDEKKPWEYRGWILPMIMDVYPAAGLGTGRWRWWLELRLNKAVPRWQKIPPRIDFVPPHGSAMRNVENCCEICAREKGFGMSAATAFVEWLAYATATAAIPPNLSEETQEQLYRTFCADHWLKHPSDYLAIAYSESKGGGKDPTAFFPTPFSVAKVMLEMTMGREPDPEGIEDTICEPCVGTGSILIHASNWSVNLFGADINPRCIMAAKINGAFYAPWIPFPIFDGVEPLLCKNMLSDPSLDGHNMEAIGRLKKG